MPLFDDSPYARDPNDESEVIVVPCQYCHVKPMHPSRMGHHLRTRHGIASTNPQSVRRRIARERARGVVSEKPNVVRPQPPVVPSIQPHQTLGRNRSLDPGKIERVRKEVLFYSHEAARRFDVPASVIVDTIKQCVDRNLEAPPMKRRSVPLGDIP